MNEIPTKKIDIPPMAKQSSKDLDFWLAIVAILCILAAGIYGYTQNSSSMASEAIKPALQRAVPEASRFEVLDSVTCAAYKDESDDSFLNYISLGEANGYGGPMLLAVATDKEGVISNVAVVEQRETPSWFNRVVANGFIDSLYGKKFDEPFKLGEDLHGVSSATLTSRALAEAALKASRNIAGVHLGLPVPPEEEKAIQFGPPEIVLLILFIVAFVGHRKSFKYTKQARWFTMLVGMFMLGFVYTNPLTISYINQALLGFWPDWHTHLYYYMLLGGILLMLIADNKNPYCLWFCPFGAVQEFMGLVGGAKQPKQNKFSALHKWAQRALAFTAIIVALILRNPGLSSYEIFGTMFDLQGSILSFYILGMVLLISIFVRRPWCNFLCPIPPVENLIKLFRRKIKARLTKNNHGNMEA